MRELGLADALLKMVDKLVKDEGAEKVIAAGQKDISVEGPFEAVAEEIVEVHRGFWKKEG